MGCGLGPARQASLRSPPSAPAARAAQTLTKAAARSKARIAAGHEPECLLDFWTKQVGGLREGRLRAWARALLRPARSRPTTPRPAPPHPQRLGPRCTSLAKPPPNRLLPSRPPRLAPPAQILSDVKDAADAGAEPPFYAADGRIADAMMDFLFASQDASTASLVWTITLMAEHPDVLARVS